MSLTFYEIKRKFNKKDTQKKDSVENGHHKLILLNKKNSSLHLHSMLNKLQNKTKISVKY